MNKIDAKKLFKETNDVTNAIKYGCGQQMAEQWSKFIFKLFQDGEINKKQLAAWSGFPWKY